MQGHGSSVLGDTTDKYVSRTSRGMFLQMALRRDDEVGDVGACDGLK